MPLDVLDAKEAAELVASRLGAERVAAESAAVEAIVGHSAGLPLALSVTCARAVARPTLRLADLAAELADARGRLDALRTGEETTDLRAVFSWSADKLSDQAARMFRLIGLHHGPDISAAAAASLAATTLTGARDRAGRTDQGLAAHRGRGGPVRLPRPAARLRRRARGDHAERRGARPGAAARARPLPAHGARGHGPPLPGPRPGAAARAARRRDARGVHRPRGLRGGARLVRARSTACCAT